LREDLPAQGAILSLQQFQERGVELVSRLVHHPVAGALDQAHV
jgi:hypothetical protein